MQDKNYRDDNTRLGDISYQLSKIALELRIIREYFTQGDLNIDPDYFNEQFKKKYDKKS